MDEADRMVDLGFEDEVPLAHGGAFFSGRTFNTVLEATLSAIESLRTVGGAGMLYAEF